MLNEVQRLELEALRAKCLNDQGQPKIDGVDTEDLVRLAELEEKAESDQPADPEEGAGTEDDLDGKSMSELKAIAKSLKIKGYGNMGQDTLLNALRAIGDVAGTEPKQETPADETEVESLEKQGYKFLGVAPNGRNCYIGPDKRPYMTSAKGVVENVGNKFGDKLLKHLKDNK